jgi:phosphatidylserine/phosphatidylglycerophosphate/cardiolipin synthase-like enzyme
MAQPIIISEIHVLIHHLPTELVERLAKALQANATLPPSQLRLKVLAELAQPTLHARINYFFTAWSTHAPELSPETIAFALQAAAYSEAQARRAQSLELVWTGPDSKVIPLRRTDQALLELINQAQKRLHLVSFAVYKTGTISQALIKAADRGVRIQIYLETPDAGEGKITFDTVRALGQKVADRAAIYIWPLDKRPISIDGKHGSLHAKIAVADGQTMFISSANLTEYAMTLNMEMGILIRGGPLPAQVETHLTRLIEQKIFNLI